MSPNRTIKPRLIRPFADQGLPEVSDLNVFPQYRRKEVGSRILDVVKDLTSKFSEFTIAQVFGVCLVENVASVRVMEKCGFETCLLVKVCIRTKLVVS